MPLSRQLIALRTNPERQSLRSSAPNLSTRIVSIAGATFCVVLIHSLRPWAYLHVFLVPQVGGMPISFTVSPAFIPRYLKCIFKRPLRTIRADEREGAFCRPYTLPRWKFDGRRELDTLRAPVKKKRKLGELS